MLTEWAEGEAGRVEESPLDRRRRAWRQVSAARTSAQHFRHRLHRSLPIVAEMATIDPYLGRALDVLTAMMANFHLAAEVLEALPKPIDLAEEVTEPEVGAENGAWAAPAHQA